MRHLAFLSLAFVFLVKCSSSIPPRVLIFSKTNGYRHESIEAGKEAMVKLCYENGIQADTTENAIYINEKNLKRYAAVVFLNTNGDVLNPRQEADFERYIQAGGGFMGVHSASATEYTWRWYGALLGGYFKDHPAIQDIALKPDCCDHLATRHLACKTWNWKEEPYNFRNYEPDIQVLLSVNDSTYKGATVPEGTPPPAHPMSWRHEFDGGRSFYTALGHIPESYTDTVFQKHLLGGLRYAIGNQKPLQYNRCRTRRLPDQTRFVKTVIASDLSEPMEIAPLPNGQVLMIERHGQIKLYNSNTGLLNTVAKLSVYSEMGDGLIGLAVDPHWQENHWIYLYYSALQDSLNQLSRFVFQGDTLNRASEKKILQVPVGRKNCFHAAGSITFDAAGNLLLATGDNTSPFESSGYTPIDERPDRQAFDAQRSSGNTNDLRGKILRIKVREDGTYSCPADNLFSQNSAIKGRPEIYVMGCRNPFRISYDPRRNFLFWGDIGSDAGKADTARGPMGHDEINRARAAGNFGWPYFNSDNQAYRDFDFASNKSGPRFDAKAPVNDSPNNTGARQLPPAQPAFIWYPYSKNRDFPITGSGGRNAMAGPVFYSDEYPAVSRFPDYYEGKVIVYDWMRNWLMAVSMDSLGNFHHLEPMADSVRLSRPMDMFFDENGSLWLIEYGTRWYSSNEDARLSRIDFLQGNRAPIAVLQSNKTAAAAPAEIEFSVSKSSDYDGDKLSFELDFGDNSQPLRFQAKSPEQADPILGRPAKDKSPRPIVHRYERPGRYQAILKVCDESGACSTQNLYIAVGNEAPSLYWDLAGRNKSFYRFGDTLDYRLVVEDREDGTLISGGVSVNDIETSIEFLEKGINPRTPEKNQAQETSSGKYIVGKQLVEQADCKNCHAVDRQINGPAYQAIAARYRNNKEFAVPSIYRKIIYGGTGNWGQSIMIPHPQIREEDAIQMSLWILSLTEPVAAPPTFPLEGKYVLQPEEGKFGAYVLRAKYRDKGHLGQERLESSTRLILRPTLLQAEKCDFRSPGVGNYSPFGNDTTLLSELKHDAFFAFHQVDLTDISNITFRIALGSAAHRYAGGIMEIRLGSAEGPVIAKTEFMARNKDRMEFEDRKLVLTKPDISAPQDLYFVFKNIDNQAQGVIGIDWLKFDLYFAQKK